MSHSNLLNRRSYFHLFLDGPLFLQESVEPCPAHRPQFTHSLDRHAALQWHQSSDLVVDAVSPGPLFAWRRASIFCKAPFKKSTSITFSPQARSRGVRRRIGSAEHARRILPQAGSTVEAPPQPATCRGTSALLRALVLIHWHFHKSSYALRPFAGTFESIASVSLCSPFPTKCAHLSCLNSRVHSSIVPLQRGTEKARPQIGGKSRKNYKLEAETRRRKKGEKTKMPGWSPALRMQIRGAGKRTARSGCATRTREGHDRAPTKRE